VLAKALLLGIVARLALDRPRPLIAVAMAYAVAGLLIDGTAAWRAWSWTDFAQPWAWWALGSRALLLALAWSLALRAVWRAPAWRHLGLAWAVGLSALLWAYVSWFALVQPMVLTVVDWNYVAHAGWVLLLGVLLLGRFADTLRQEARLRAELATQLDQRTAELQASFEALQRSERARTDAERAGAVAGERERLMQEMHDGIGAQLITARLQVAAGSVGPAEAAALIDDCLLELRLTVDALSLDDGDLGALLAALRLRLAPALRAAGMALDWQVQATPALAALQGTGARELLRIVQEAVSNVLHHAQARRLRVATAVVEGAVQLSVADDGIGRAADAPAGRGTQSMQQRAQRLGASLGWHQPAPHFGCGTELWLRLPLAP
jgi:signal transduction histidine kinase